MPFISSTYSSSADVSRNAMDKHMRTMDLHAEALAKGEANVSAAEKAIGNKLGSIAKSLAAAKQNTEQGAAMISVAEGSLNKIVEELSDAQALATKSTQGSVDDISRGLLQKEYAAKMSQINIYASQTRWNGQALLAGGNRATTDAGTVAGTTSVLVAAPANTFDETTDVITGFAEGTVQSTAVSGSTGAYDVTVKVVNQAGTQTFTAINFAEGGGNTLTLTNSVTGGTISVDCAAAVTGITNAATFKTALDTMFGTNPGGTPVTLVSPSAAFANGLAAGATKASAATAAGVYGLSHAAGASVMELTDGVNVWTQNVTAGAQNVVFDNGVTVTLTSAFTLATVNDMTKFTVTTDGFVAADFQTAEQATDLLDLVIDEVTTGKLGLGFTSVDTEANAKIATPLLAAAVASVNGSLATLKAQKYQLEATGDNLATELENVNSAKATFLSPKVAEEMTKLTSSSVSSQIANSMVGQMLRQQRELVDLVR